MTEHDLQTKGIRLVGYGALIARFHLEVIPNWHHSFVATGNARRTDTTAGMTKEVYPARYWPGDTLGDHLEFALKYDGTNLAILASVFNAAPVKEVQQYVASAPRGKYIRRLWFLFGSPRVSAPVTSTSYRTRKWSTWRMPFDPPTVMA